MTPNTQIQDMTKCHFDSKAKSALFIYIHVGYIHCILYKTGEYMQFEYIQVLDIFCQQLGDMYQLEGYPCALQLQGFGICIFVFGICIFVFGGYMTVGG